MISQGDVAFVKTTGEAVYVLEVSDPAPKIGDKDFKVTVRRPIAGRDGIQHIEDYFRLGELESLEDQRKRFMSEREEVMQKYGPKAAEFPSITDTGFSNN